MQYALDTHDTIVVGRLHGGVRIVSHETSYNFPVIPGLNIARTSFEGELWTAIEHLIHEGQHDFNQGLSKGGLYGFGHRKWQDILGPSVDYMIWPYNYGPTNEIGATDYTLFIDFLHRCKMRVVIEGKPPLDITLWDLLLRSARIRAAESE